MATYKEIQEYVKLNYGYTPKSCWISHMKEICDLKPRISPRRYSPNSRVYPCPPDKQKDIQEAFKHFKMI